MCHDNRQPLRTELVENTQTCKACLATILNAITSWENKNLVKWGVHQRPYGIERIMGHRRENENVLPEFRVQWLGGNEAAWVREDQLVNCGMLLRRYLSTQGDKAKQELSIYHSVATAVYRRDEEPEICSPLTGDEAQQFQNILTSIQKFERQSFNLTDPYTKKAIRFKNARAFWGNEELSRLYGKSAYLGMLNDCCVFTYFLLLAKHRQGIHVVDPLIIETLRKPGPLPQK
ncbi:hypothetical protein BDD12DRAFT_945723, partial [Trichophaea hybrida]